MQQSFTQSQTFNLSGHIISLNFRIEAAGNANQIDKPKELSTARVTDIDRNLSSAEHNENPILLPEHKCETGEDSVDKLKERLRLADLRCSKLQELYQKYRLRWLEECYRVHILEEYAPTGIDTFSPRQIAWDAPSPTQDNGDDIIEVQE